MYIKQVCYGKCKLEIVQFITEKFFNLKVIGKFAHWKRGSGL